MRLRTARSRWVLLPAGAGAVLALLALLIAGSRSLTVRTASAGAPNQFTIATLRPGHAVCEGPVTPQEPTGSIGIWGNATGPSARLTVTVNDAGTHQRLATGSLRAVAREAEWTARLARTVRAREPVQVCLAEDAGVFSLAGSVSSGPQVVSTGIPGGQRFSLILLDDGHQSLLGSLSLAFSRASLWRLSWVGSWTFWVLALALVMTFGLAVAAVVKAAEDDDPPPPSEPPDPPANDLPSETRQDRPQPVP